VAELNNNVQSKDEEMRPYNIGKSLVMGVAGNLFTPTPLFLPCKPLFKLLLKKVCKKSVSQYIQTHKFSLKKLL